MSRILCPVIVGRAEERAQLSAAVDACHAGRGRVVLVVGAPGLGKSRLLTEVADRARAGGATVLLGRGVPSHVHVPYRPIAEALLAAAPSRLPDAPELSGFGAALAGIVPAWRADTPEAPVESPVVVAEAVRRALLAVAGARGCVLLLEDLQWADPDTLQALEYLADHSGESPLLSVGTTRDEPAAPAVRMLLRLEARRAVDVVRLQPLTPDDVAEMAVRSLDVGTLEPGVVRLVSDGAEGVPFLVEELLAAAIAGGALVRGDREWQVTGAVPRLVPPTFAATVAERVTALGADGRRLLGAAALLGRRFDWRIAARAAGCESGAHALLESAVAQQLLAAHWDGFTFRHALTREAMLEELLPTERMRLASRCLEALGSEPRGDDERDLAADLAEAAGEPDRAAGFLLDAGRTSLRLGALETATATLERAAGLAVAVELRTDILESLARARSAVGDLRATEAAVDALLGCLSALDAPPRRSAEAQLLLARCAIGATHFPVAGEALDRARRLAATAGDVGLTARVGAVAAHQALAEGRPDEAEALAVRAAADAEGIGDDEVVCEALEVATRCARLRDLAEARAVAVRALDTAERAGLALWRMRALYQLGVAEMFQSGSVETLERARAEAERLGAVATAATLDLEIAAGLEAQFRLDESRATAERCIERARLFDLRSVEAVAHAFLAITRARPGSRADMEAGLERSQAILPYDPDITGALWGDARAVASLAAEDRPRARQELDRAVSLFGPGAAVVPRLATAMRALVMAVDGEEPDLAPASGVTLLNGQAGGYAAYARAVALGRAGRSEEAGEQARRGDALLELMPWYRNLVRRLAAEAALRDGWGEPVAWLSEAAEFFDGSGDDRVASACRSLLRGAGVRVPRRTAARGELAPDLRRAGVTPREAEVLALVAEGLSNRDIGARLFLSERTVEQHVGALKQKLQMRTRAQLAVHAAAEGEPVPR